MKQPRWRKIQKVMKPHASKLLDLYFHNEHAVICYGQSVISDSCEIHICETFGQYSGIVSRTAKSDRNFQHTAWILVLSDFA